MASVWFEDNGPSPRYPSLNGDIETDTAIIGGGLAGILCARLLKERGVDSVVIEAKQIGSGTTGRTTAKITAQHGLIYSEIEKRHGFQTAKEYWQANTEAVDAFRHLAKTIPFDFEEKTAYVYSRNDRQKLDKEAALYKRMGIDPVFQKNPPVPVKTVGALGMERQAQMHLVKFLHAVADGLSIYENTFATQLKPGRIVTDKGVIQARRIVLATHFPMVNLRGLYFLKLYRSRSYVLALTGAEDPGALYIDEQEGGLSLRAHKGYLLLGGGGHKTGKQGGGFDTLRSVAQTAYPGAREAFAWAAQDCMTLDSMPYIGRHRANNRELYVATGFNKWGMSGCMAAAKLLAELITEGENRYAALFSPSRSILHPQLLANLGQAASGLLSFGKRCPHMGCALKWNTQELTWDCPCHGSRFDRKGNLIDNPAKKGISVE